jgi:hypothetical protein
MSIRVSNIKFYENPSSGSRLDTCVQAEGYDKANRRFSRLYEDAPKNEFVSSFLPSIGKHCCCVLCAIRAEAL